MLDRPTDDLAVVAHRGYAGAYPENTVAAAVRAADHHETAAIEVDVRPAADETPVVFHDDHLEGDRDRDGRPLTDATGRVAETPLETVREAEVLGSGEPVPTLAELVAAVPDSVGLVVELKSHGGPDRGFGIALDPDQRRSHRDDWEPFVARVVEDCAGFGGELLFSSFYEGAIAALRAVDPTLAAAPLVWHDLEAGLAIADRYDCEAIHPPLNAIAGTPLAETAGAGFGDESPAIDVVERAHDAGRAVTAWTATGWRQVADLEAVGVDGVIADYPGLTDDP